MKFFSLISKDDEVSPNTRVLAPEAFSALLDAQELLEATKKDCEAYRQEVEEECEKLRQEAKDKGFEEGSQAWSEQLANLSKEGKDLKEQMREAIVPLAIASIKKIIGKELETRPETIVSIITESLKKLTQSKQILIQVNPSDVPVIEQSRPELKKIVEYAETFIIAPKEEVAPGGCVIETESGIINAQLDVQLAALEKAFSSVLKQKPEETSSPKQANEQ